MPCLPPPPSAGNKWKQLAASCAIFGPDSSEFIKSLNIFPWNNQCIWDIYLCKIDYDKNSFIYKL